MKNSNNPLDTRSNSKIKSSAEDCPFPANFEEVFLQEFHRRRDERCLARVKRWCVRQWEACDFRWGSFLGGAATATAVIALTLSYGGFFINANNGFAKPRPDTSVNVDKDKKDATPVAPPKGIDAETGIEVESDSSKEEEPDQDDQPVVNDRALMLPTSFQ